MDRFRFYGNDDNEPLFECYASAIDDAVCRFGDSIAGKVNNFEVWVEREGDARIRVRGLIETVVHTTWWRRA